MKGWNLKHCLNLLNVSPDDFFNLIFDPLANVYYYYTDKKTGEYVCYNYVEDFKTSTFKKEVDGAKDNKGTGNLFKLRIMLTNLLNRDDLPEVGLAVSQCDKFVTKKSRRCKLRRV